MKGFGYDYWFSNNPETKKFFQLRIIVKVDNHSC